ncbi:MAG: response regulator transcription factor [Anaerolineae bacterium]|nr:response regulator transcription factor [Anaerolineae bacterium]
MNQPDTRKILIVDDEASLRLFLSEELTEEGYQVFTAANGHQALTLLSQHPIDLAIVDLQMPGINGLELMAAIEQMADPPELIMLTAHASLETSIEAMRLGTSDFLLKPYEIEELLEAIERVMKRRQLKLQQRLAARLLAESFGVTPAPAKPQPDFTKPKPTPPTRLEVRSLAVEWETMVVSKNGRTLSLSPTEFRLLTTLMKHPDQPLTFQELADLVHGQTVDAYQARDLLKSHLGRLRRKLGQAPDGGAYIINVHSVGYKFATE